MFYERHESVISSTVDSRSNQLRHAGKLFNYYDIEHRCATMYVYKIEECIEECAVLRWYPKSYTTEILTFSISVLYELIRHTTISLIALVVLRI